MSLSEVENKINGFSIAIKGWKAMFSSFTQKSAPNLSSTFKPSS